MGLKLSLSDKLKHFLFPNKIPAQVQYKNTNWFTISIENGLQDNCVLSLAFDDNKLWIGTKKGLNLFDTNDNVFLRNPFLNVLKDTPINSIFIDGNIILIGAKDCIINFDKSTNEYTFFVYKENTGGEPICKTEHANKCKITSYNHDTFPQGGIYTFANDGEYIWIGTSAGVYRYNKYADNIEKRFEKIDFLYIEDPLSIVCDERAVYIGCDSESAGLTVGIKQVSNSLDNNSQFDMKTGYEWSRYKMRYVRSLAQDRDSLYIGSASDCFMIKKEDLITTKKNIKEPKFLFRETSVFAEHPNIFFMTLTVHKNRLWAGGGSGIGFYDLNTGETVWYSRCSTDNPISKYILCICSTNDKVFCGTEGAGLVILKLEERLQVEKTTAFCYDTPEKIRIELIDICDKMYVNEKTQSHSADITRSYYEYHKSRKEAFSVCQSRIREFDCKLYKDGQEYAKALYKEIEKCMNYSFDYDDGKTAVRDILEIIKKIGI